jgi:hypothetical protein
MKGTSTPKEHGNLTDMFRHSQRSISIIIFLCVFIYMDWGLSHGNYIFGKIDRSRRNMEIYKGKWMVLGALGCINNADLEKIIPSPNP